MTDSEERKIALSDLIKDGEENILVDNSDMLSLFKKFAQEAEEYKYFSNGYADLMTALQNEIDIDGEFKSFLMGFIDSEETTTVFDAISSSLS